MNKTIFIAVSLIITAGLCGCSCMTGSLPISDEDGEENLPDTPDAPGENEQRDIRPDQDSAENPPDNPVETPDTPETVDVVPDEEELPEGCNPSEWMEYPSTTTPVNITDHGTTTDSVTVNACPYNVKDIKIFLDFSCSCMYCLNIALERPDGLRFPLYRELFTTAEFLRGTIPDNLGSAVDLCMLTGGGYGGPWTLRIENDSYQLGTINAWSLWLKGDYENCREDAYYPSDVFPMAIPDNDTRGVTSSVEVPGDFTINQVEVYVSILHDYISDIVITLTAPSGTQRVLYSHSGSVLDYKINVTFPTDMAPVDDLAALNGQGAQGTWQLKVADTQPVLTGEFLGWILYVH